MLCSKSTVLHSINFIQLEMKKVSRGKFHFSATVEFIELATQNVKDKTSYELLIFKLI